jgi:hypothetical protein
MPAITTGGTVAHKVLLKRGLLVACGLGLLGTSMAVPTAASADNGRPSAVAHTLLISVDGMHQSDLALYVRNHPSSNLAEATRDGVDYSNARTPFPSDSSPGMIGQTTGGTPKSTGFYYDDTWNHDVFPPGTTSCSGPAPGAEVAYHEAVDKNPGALDAGQGIVPAPGSDPWANILNMTGNPLDVIDPAKLPVDSHTCQPVLPSQYLKVNTIFEVAHQSHLVTAWSDKHPAYQVMSGPSGNGVDDYFTPEINSSANPAAPTDPSQNDWTTDNLLTQQYDNYKVDGVLNWIDGHFHNGKGNLGTPAIFGMNFQSVSTAQKLPQSRTENTSGQAPGGYLSDGRTPGPVLNNALNFVDASIGRMTSELRKQHLLDHTAIIVSAKHGQSPMDQASLNRIKDSQIIDAMNVAWKAQHPQAARPLVAQGTDDDGMLLWLNDRSQTATDFARSFLLNYHDSSASIDGKPVVSAGLQTVYAGSAAATFIGVSQTDPRVPDVIGIAQHGVVYTGKKAKIAEHGGDDIQDRNVPILVVAPRGPHGSTNSSLVETTQIAPTILSLLGLDPNQLQAVRSEGTKVLP